MPAAPASRLASLWLAAMPLLFVALWSTGFIGAKFGLPYAADPARSVPAAPPPATPRSAVRPGPPWWRTDRIFPIGSTSIPAPP